MRIYWIILVAVATLLLLICLHPPETLPQSQGYVKLPPPEYESETSVEEAILKRQSVREYLPEPLTLKELSQLLWAAQGITHDGKRAAPSAGALYPLTVYVVVGDVTGLESGLYEYIPETHELVRLSRGDLREDVYEAALYQPWVKNAPIDLIIAANYSRTTQRYGERGVRYVHMEAGHVSENVYLQAVSLGLGTVCVGAFYDERLREILGISEDPVSYTHLTLPTKA